MKWCDLGAEGDGICPLGLKLPAHQEVCKCTGIHFQALKCLGTQLNDSIQFSGSFAASGLRKQSPKPLGLLVTNKRERVSGHHTIACTSTARVEVFSPYVKPFLSMLSKLQPRCNFFQTVERTYYHHSRQQGYIQVRPQTYLSVTNGMQVAVDQKPQSPGAASLPS